MLPCQTPLSTDAHNAKNKETVRAYTIVILTMAFITVVFACYDAKFLITMSSFFLMLLAMFGCFDFLVSNTPLNTKEMKSFVDILNKTPQLAPPFQQAMCEGKVIVYEHLRWLKRESSKVMEGMSLRDSQRELMNIKPGKTD